jgi:hypothetical protein
MRATADALVQSQAVLAESHSSLAENQVTEVLKRVRKEMASQSMPGTPVSSGTLPPTGSQPAWWVCQVVGSP